MTVLTSDATVENSRTLILETPLPQSSGKVRVVVQTLGDAPSRPTLSVWLADLRARQAARGHSPRSADEIALEIRTGRDER